MKSGIGLGLGRASGVVCAYGLAGVNAVAGASGAIPVPVSSLLPAPRGAAVAVELAGPGDARFGLIAESRTEHDALGDAMAPLDDRAPGVSLSGRLDGGGSFVLAASGEGVWGAMWTPAGSFEIRGTGEVNANGEPIATIVPVPGDLPGCAVGLSEAHVSDAPGVLNDAGVHAHGHGHRGGETTTRAFIVFTTNALSNIGGSANVPSFALAAIESANEAYENSNINPLRLELAGYTVSDTPPDTGASAVLRYATGRGEGYLDDGQALREAYDADIMPVICDIAGACGVAWLSPDNELYSSYSVTDPNCAIGNLTFAHEVGHNFGATHDPDNAGGSYTQYAYGHRWNTVQGQFRSVMAYSPGTRVPQFSNPDIEYFGVATGIDGERDNARLHNLTGGILANYRSGTGDPADCDGSGMPDAVEIVLGTVRDDNRNGTPDSCDIAADPSLDCDDDGVLDAFQIRPRVEVATLPVGPVDNTGGAQIQLTGLPEADGTVELVLIGHGDLGSDAEYLTVTVGSGGFSFEVFTDSPGDCYAPHLLESVNLPAAAFNSLLVGGTLDLSLAASSEVDAGVCSIPTQVTFRLDYQTLDSAADADGDGVLDACAPVCIADYNGDGLANILDVVDFVSNWNAAGPGADFNDDGNINILDVVDFVGEWAQGCPSL